jgi:hypothetical protein
MEFTPVMTLSTVIFVLAYALIVIDKIDRVIVALSGGILV